MIKKAFSQLDSVGTQSGKKVSGGINFVVFICDSMNQVHIFKARPLFKGTPRS